LCCSQKIAVNDAGIGVVIDCPTCAQRLIVPPDTDYEFQGETGVRAVPFPPATASQRSALIPHLARLMMNRLVQTLLFQRRELLDTQNAAADQLAAIEQRLALLHTKMQRRLHYYEERVALLQTESDAKDLEIHNLQERLRQLAGVMKPRPLGTLPRLARDNKDSARRLLVGT
jgi:hypothetical protein